MIKMSFFRSLFGKKPDLDNNKPPVEGYMHDFRSCMWGHNVIFYGPGEIENSQRLSGWCTPYMEQGDVFLYPATKGIAVWYMLKCESEMDPADMFSGTAGIIRYATKADLDKLLLQKTSKSIYLN